LVCKVIIVDDFIVFIFGIKNGAKEIRTEIESFFEQACGLKLNVDNILTIHLSSKWFHSSRAKCQKTLKIERSFYTYD
jgi:hypothetical protein